MPNKALILIIKPVKASAAMFDEDEVQPRSEDVIGQNLDAWSVGELEELIQRLHAEIKRVEAERNRKRGDRSAAESLFKS